MRKKSFPAVVWALIVGGGISSFSAAMCIPFFAIFLAKQFELKPSAIGLVLATWPIGIVVGSFVCGYWADRFGRRRLAVGSLIFYGAMYLLMGAVALSKPSTAAVITLTLLNGLAGFACTFYFSSCQALMADLVDQQELHRAIRVRYSAMSLGGAFGPIAGMLLGLAGKAGAFFVDGAAPILLAAVLAVMLSRAKSHAPAESTTRATFPEAMRVLRSDRKLLFALLGSAVFTAIFHQFEISAPQHLIATFSDGLQKFSYLVTLNGIAVVVFQLALLSTLRKWGTLPTLTIGCLAVAAGCVCFAQAGAHFWAYCVAVALISLGEMMVFPTALIQVDELARPDLKATYYAASNLRWIGKAVGMIGGGYALEHGGGHALFLGAAVLCGGAVVFYQAAGRRAPELAPSLATASQT